MKKIAFILQDLTGGGAERTVANLSFELSNYYEFYIIVYNGENVSYPHKAMILDLKMPPKKSKIGKIINTLRRVCSVRQLKRKYKFDYVISFMFGANIVNVLSKGNERIITSARNYLSSYGRGRGYVIRERFVANCSDKVVAISKMVERDLVENFKIDKKKTVTIYNPCDIGRIQQYANETPNYKFRDGIFYFVNVARLVEQKGQWDLIKAFKIIAERNENIKLLILGMGPLESKLKALVKSLGIYEKVDFLGFVDNPFAIMKHSNAFVLSSLHEGLGNVLLEALACGLPVISTDCFAGPREILAPNTNPSDKTERVEQALYGILVPEFQHRMNFSTELEKEHYIFADAMERVCQNSDLSNQYIRDGKRRLDDFESKKIASEWKTLFLELNRSK